MIDRLNDGKVRTGAAIFVAWVLSGSLIIGAPAPVHQLAGLALCLFLPGWLAAEAVLGGRDVSREYWVIITIGVSLGVTIAIGGLASAIGDFTSRTLGWSWLGVTAIIGMGALSQHGSFASATISKDGAGRSDKVEQS
jgi:hypothetical protein